MEDKSVEYFQNLIDSLTYPTRKSFDMPNRKEFGSTNEYRYAVMKYNRMVEEDIEMVKRLRNEYRSKVSGIEHQFVCWVIQDLGLTELPDSVSKLMSEFISNKNHSDGLHEAYGAVEDIAKLVTVAYEEGKKDIDKP